MDETTKQDFITDVSSILTAAKSAQHPRMVSVSSLAASLRGGMSADYRPESKRRWRNVGTNGTLEARLRECGFEVRKSHNERGNPGNFVFVKAAEPVAVDTSAVVPMTMPNPEPRAKPCSTCKKPTSWFALNGYDRCGECQAAVESSTKARIASAQADVEIKSGDKVEIIGAGMSRYTPLRITVDSAHNYRRSDGWFIEGHDEGGRYVYWKQGPDGGHVRLVEEQVECVGCQGKMLRNVEDGSTPVCDVCIDDRATRVEPGDYSMLTDTGAFLGYQRAMSQADALRLWNTKYPSGWPYEHVWLAGKKAVTATWTDTSDGAGFREG